RLAPAPRGVVQHALKLGVEREVATVLAPVLYTDLPIRPIQQNFLVLRVQLVPRRVERDAERFAHLIKDFARPAILTVGVPGSERALADRQLRVGDDKIRVKLAADAQALARRAGAVRAVERECARLDLRQA